MVCRLWMYLWMSRREHVISILVFQLYMCVLEPYITPYLRYMVQGNPKPKANCGEKLKTLDRKAALRSR
jgi:hypothetical protein